MTTLDFDDRNVAHVSLSEFNEYMTERTEKGDYTKEKNGVMYYYNGGDCLIAKYDNNEGCGFIF